MADVVPPTPGSSPALLDEALEAALHTLAAQPDRSGRYGPQRVTQIASAAATAHTAIASAEVDAAASARILTTWRPALDDARRRLLRHGYICPLCETLVSGNQETAACPCCGEDPLRAPEGGALPAPRTSPTREFIACDDTGYPDHGLVAARLRPIAMAGAPTAGTPGSDIHQRALLRHFSHAAPTLHQQHSSILARCLVLPELAALAAAHGTAAVLARADTLDHLLHDAEQVRPEAAAWATRCWTAALHGVIAGEAFGQAHQTLVNQRRSRRERRRTLLVTTGVAVAAGVAAAAGLVGWELTERRADARAVAVLLDSTRPVDDRLNDPLVVRQRQRAAVAAPADRLASDDAAAKAAAAQAERERVAAAAAAAAAEDLAAREHAAITAIVAATSACAVRDGTTPLTLVPAYAALAALLDTPGVRGVSTSPTVAPVIAQAIQVYHRGWSVAAQAAIDAAYDRTQAAAIHGMRAAVAALLADRLAPDEPLLATLRQRSAQLDLDARVATAIEILRATDRPVSERLLDARVLLVRDQPAVSRIAADVEGLHHDQLDRTAYLAAMALDATIRGTTAEHISLAMVTAFLDACDAYLAQPIPSSRKRMVGAVQDVVAWRQRWNGGQLHAIRFAGITLGSGSDWDMTLRSNPNIRIRVAVGQQPRVDAAALNDVTDGVEVPLDQTCSLQPAWNSPLTLEVVATNKPLTAVMPPVHIWQLAVSPIVTQGPVSVRVVVPDALWPALPPYAPARPQP